MRLESVHILRYKLIRGTENYLHDYIAIKSLANILRPEISSLNQKIVQKKSATMILVLIVLTCIRSWHCNKRIDKYYTAL